MEDMTILNEVTYQKKLSGISIVGGDQVEIIGERTVELSDGRVLHQYLYNIIGYTPKNGLPFVSLKPNIIIE